MAQTELVVLLIIKKSETVTKRDKNEKIWVSHFESDKTLFGFKDSSQ